MKRLLTRSLIGLVVMFSLAACGVADQPTTQNNVTPIATGSPNPDNQAGETPKIGANDAILKIRTEGGFCTPGGCWTEQQIQADGVYRIVDGTGVRKEGTLDDDQVAELTQLIAAANFDEISSQPFTGTCPIAYDGQELIYTFQTLSGEETIASCKVAIDENSPLFRQIATLMEEMNQE